MQKIICFVVVAFFVGQSVGATLPFEELQNPERTPLGGDLRVLTVGINVVLAMNAKLGCVIKKSSRGYLTEGYFRTNLTALRRGLHDINVGMTVDVAMLAREAARALANMCQAWHYLFEEMSWPKDSLSVDWLLGYHLDGAQARAAHRHRVSKVTGCPLLTGLDVPFLVVHHLAGA